MNAKQIYRTFSHEAWAALLITVHLAVMIFFWVPVSSGPDSNGYYIQTRLLVEEGQLWAPREQMLQYISPHWLVVVDDMLISRYPPGMAFIQAIPYWLTGTGVTLVNPMLTTGTLVAVFLLARRWVGSRWGFLALLFAALNPVANAWTYMGDAHPAVSFFLMWGLYFLDRWSERRAWWPLVLIGLWFGMIPTFRYPEVLYLCGVTLFVAATGRWSLRALAQAFVIGLAGILPLIAVYSYNYWMFGGVGETGYGTGEHLFSLWNFLFKLFPYLGMILGYGVAGFAALGMVGMVWLCRQNETFPCGILLAGIVVPITVLYMAYFFFDASLRFLMPTLFLYILAGVMFLKYWIEHSEGWVRRWTPTFVAASLLLCLVETGIGFSITATGHSATVEATRVIQEHVPRHSVVIAPSSIQSQLDFVGGWKLVDASVISWRQGFTGMPPQRPEGFHAEQRGIRERPSPHPGGMDGGLMEELMQVDVRKEIHKRYRSEKPGTVSPLFWQDVKAWANGQHKVYWVGIPEEIESLCGGQFEMTPIAEFEEPRGGMAGGPPAQRSDFRTPEPRYLTLMKLSW